MKPPPLLLYNMIMQELTAEQIGYAYTWLNCKLQPFSSLGIEALQDVKQDAMKGLVRRWRKYNNQKTTWKTFLCVCLKGALCDALRHYQRRWKGHLDIADDEIETADVAQGESVDGILSEIEDELSRKIARYRYEGCADAQIMATFGLDAETYNGIIEELRDFFKKRR